MPRRRTASRTLAVAAVAVLVLLGTVLLGLFQEGAGQGALPRAQGVARELIDPPVKAITRTAKTSDAGATPSFTSASATASAAASPTASASAPAGGTPVVPAAPPPEDQTPAESQYGGAN